MLYVYTLCWPYNCHMHPCRASCRASSLVILQPVPSVRPWNTRGDKRMHHLQIVGISVSVHFLVMMWIVLVCCVTVLVTRVRSSVGGAPEASGGEDAAEYSWRGPECLDYTNAHDYWSYRWCFEASVSQFRLDKSHQHVEFANAIDTYLSQHSRETDESVEQWFLSSDATCENEKHEMKQRSAVVNIYCCLHQHPDMKYLIASVAELQQCHYSIKVCAIDACDFFDPASISMDGLSRANNKRKSPGSKTWKVSDSSDTNGAGTDSPPGGQRKRTSRDTSVKKLLSNHDSKDDFVTPEEQIELRDQARRMFVEAYDAYMTYGFPKGELAPLTCRGQVFDPIKLPLVTLIDALDTLVVLQNYTEFCHAVSTIEAYFRDSKFAFDINISVFETTIRILGGLLSGHMIAIDENLSIYGNSDPEISHVCKHYDGGLLELAIDLGDRLMPAFSTPTGIPYGTVNLKHGVPNGETPVSSTAGAGSLLLEFEVLSRLSGRMRYGVAAKTAVDALIARRSEFGLFGKHINIKTGKWAETASGIGSNSDSFYEYILKSHFLFGTPQYDKVFAENYLAVKRFNQLGDWFVDVDMNSGQVRRQMAENLQAFWPGVESSLGLTRSSARFLNSLYAVLLGIGFMPEEFDFLKWQLPSSNSGGSSSYLLRPELIESTYMHYRSTMDRSWLTPAKWFLNALETNTRTSCGYAIVDNVDSMKLANSMPSYFLAETCKYLFLIFDENNFFHSRPIIFSTEAHIFDALELDRIHRSVAPDYYAGVEVQLPDDMDRKETEMFSAESTFSDMLHNSLRKCPRKMWWEKEHSFVKGFEDFIGAPLGKAFDAQLIREPPPHIVYNPHEELFCPPRLFNYLLGSEYSSQSAIWKAVERSGGVCAAKDEAFYRLAAAEKEAAITDDANKVPEGTTIGPDYYSYEELRPDGNKILHSVKFENTPLGDFTVDVYATGFSVVSSLFKNVLHIFNLGQPNLYATERHNLALPPETASHVDEVVGELTDLVEIKREKKLVMGSTTGHVHRCSTQLVVTGLIFRNEDGHVENSADIWRDDVVVVQDFNGGLLATKPILKQSIFPLSEEVLSKGLCTTAVFGKTSTSHSSSPTSLIGELVFPEDKLGCVSPLVALKRSTESGHSADDLSLNNEKYSDFVLPYQGKILVAERGKCTFEEKALHAQSGGAIGLLVINSEVPLFTMGAALQSEIQIDLNGASGDPQSLFNLLRLALSRAPSSIDPMTGFPFPIKPLNAEEVENSNEGEGIDSPPFKEIIRDSVESLASSMKSLTNGALSALSSFSAPRSASRPVLIPAVMVSQNYGLDLVNGFHHLRTKGFAAKLIIEAESIPDILDGYMNEGISRDSKFPKMIINRNSESGDVTSLYIWTEHSWGAIIVKNQQQSWELRILSNPDFASHSLGFREKNGSPLDFQMPDVSNSVHSYSLLINRVCDGRIHPANDVIGIAI